jgi:hypothetical protein
MRIGANPNSQKKLEIAKKSHRVIIAVYIPNTEGYFTDSVKIFKICTTSLLKTINDDTSISIISNGSCKEVNEYIFQLWNEKKIDRAIFNKENVGKMNAIISEARASFEEFITFSDADVFFDKGWLAKTFEIFGKVPLAGFVSMNPTPQNLSFANSTILDNIFNMFFREKKTKEVCTYDDLAHFHLSTGKNSDFTNKMLDSKIYCVGKKGNYIIGAGHFCCTIRKDQTLKFVPGIQSDNLVSGGSESFYLDIPFDKTGLWRLSSAKAYVWHMGNVLEEEWTNKKLGELTGFIENRFSFDTLPKNKKNTLHSIVPYRFRNILGSLVIKVLKKIN